MNIQVVVTLDGRIVTVSDPLPGGCDQQQWKNLDWREQFIDKNYGLMADGGYSFNPRYEDKKILGYRPYKKPKTEGLSDEKKVKGEEASNIRHAEYEVIVPEMPEYLRLKKEFE